MIIKAGKFPAFIVSLGDWEKKPRLKAKTSVRFFTYRGVEDSRLPGFQASRGVKEVLT
jgi:hypothetical protein